MQIPREKSDESAGTFDTEIKGTPLRATLEKRVKVFVKQIEHEFAAKGPIAAEDKSQLRLGIFTSEERD